MSTSLRVITLNCWGLKYISKHRHARLTEIGAQLAAADPPPDIVGLQECWTQQDYLAIRAATAHILPHGKFYFSGIFGGGLAILSRWPIEESSMVRYPLNGRPAAFYRGDWYVGKGVACARIRIGRGKGDVVEVFCTHLHAPYESEPFDSYICHRTAQAWEITKLMRGGAERGHLVIGLGDFNMRPMSLAHRLIETHAPVEDVWRVLHPDSSVGAAKDAVETRRGKPVPTAEYNLAVNGTTCDSALNTWRWNKGHQKQLARGEDVQVESTVLDPNAKRLDYIFFGQDEGKCVGPRWKVRSANVGMIGRHPTLRCSLTDHFSVEATLVRDGLLSVEDPDSATTANESTDDENAGLRLDGSPNARFLPLEVYDEILAMINAYDSRERRQRRLRLSHFLLEVAISIGCLTAVWWSPHNFVSFVLMLVSTFGLSAGVIDGLMGGLFVGSELRALKEFEWEVRNVRAAAAAKDRKEPLLNKGSH